MMLLRRVTRHVRSQNWFAVGVDFLIVVVGVFVGLQVQDWNDARKERAEERALLGRLLTETRELLDAHSIALNELKAQLDLEAEGIATVLRNDLLQGRSLPPRTSIGGPLTNCLCSTRCSKPAGSACCGTHRSSSN